MVNNPGSTIKAADKSSYHRVFVYSSYLLEVLYREDIFLDRILGEKLSSF